MLIQSSEGYPNKGSNYDITIIMGSYIITSLCGDTYSTVVSCNSCKQFVFDCFVDVVVLKIYVNQ